MNNKKHGELSRIVSQALRHAPDTYNIRLDSDGWVLVEDLLRAIRILHKEDWSAISEIDIQEMMAHSKRRRHETRDGRIRAVYGHSTFLARSNASIAPPMILFHGTSPQAAHSIRSDGLMPMSRRYVHLSTTKAAAEEVGRRHSKTPVVLVVRARDAYRRGVHFHQGDDIVWLAEWIPAEFVEISE